MDKTKIYILQCEKAVEIKERWDLRAGDFFTRSLTDGVWTLGQTELDNINGIGRERCHKMSYSTWIGSKIWLPRQDQLQGMVKEKDMKNRSHESICLIKEIHSFVFGNCPYLWSVIENWSMEQLWLAFVMKEKYNKTWDGNKWILQNQ